MGDETPDSGWVMRLVGWPDKHNGLILAIATIALVFVTWRLVEVTENYAALTRETVELVKEQNSLTSNTVALMEEQNRLKLMPYVTLSAQPSSVAASVKASNVTKRGDIQDSPDILPIKDIGGHLYVGETGDHQNILVFYMENKADIAASIRDITMVVKDPKTDAIIYQPGKFFGDPIILYPREPLQKHVPCNQGVFLQDNKQEREVRTEFEIKYRRSPDDGIEYSYIMIVDSVIVGKDLKQSNIVKQDYTTRKAGAGL